VKTTRREDLGEILPIDVTQQPRKVRKHFYCERECWGALVGVDIGMLVGEFRAAFGHEEIGVDDESVPGSRATVVLHRHHDKFYGPAYLSSLAESTTTWAPQLLHGATRALACSTDGVLIAFDRLPRCKVVTAFRPDLPLRSVSPTTEDFRHEARRRWRQSVHRSGQHAETEDLADALASDRGDLASLWRIVVALGRARAVLEGPAASLLAQADARLQKISPTQQQGMLREIDEAAALDALADAVVEGDLPELLNRLVALEDILVAVNLLGDEARAARLTDEVAVRASCIGPELVEIAAYAERRAAASRGTLQQYWQEVGSEALANAIRLSPPARDRSSLLELLSGWVADVVRATQASVAELVSGIAVSQPSLARGERPSEVHAYGIASTERVLRAFLVDQDHPTGEDVSDLLTRTGLRWSFQGWQVSPGDDAVLVVLTGPDDESLAGGLGEVLARAGQEVAIDALPLTGAR
jgi:hypothetical protein